MWPRFPVVVSDELRKGLHSKDSDSAQRTVRAPCALHTSPCTRPPGIKGVHSSTHVPRLGHWAMEEKRQHTGPAVLGLRL